MFDLLRQFLTPLWAVFSPPASPGSLSSLSSLLPLLSSLALVLGWGGGMSSTLAAQRLTLRLGPFEQEVAVADLAKFAKTGQLSPALQPYASVLTPQVRQVLNRRLQIDSNQRDKLIDQVLRSPTGEQLLTSLAAAFPNSTLPQLQAAAALAVRQSAGLSVVSFLQAYPKENVTVDASSAIALALQFNPTYWQSQALAPLLERDLAVNSDTPFRPAFDPALPGPQTVQQQTLFFQDQKRQRTIPVDLYWSNNPQGPLVVISHGFGANRKFFAYLARHLASYGLTVAALEHPGSNTKWLNSVSTSDNAGGLVQAREFIDRPKDVSFLLDELAKLNQQPGPLQGKLHTQQVSIIGHSLGGYTALALAGAEVDLVELRRFCKSVISIGKAPSDLFECAAGDLPERRLQLKDKRIAQVIALNPLVGHIFGKTGLTQVTTPTLILAGTEDVLTPLVNNQLQPFTQLGGIKYLLTAIGGTHLSVGDPAYLGGTVNQSTLVKERLGAETQPLRYLVRGVSLAFIEQLTPAAKTYTPFLTPAYAQSLSTPQLPLRLNTELPASVTRWIEVVVEASQLPLLLGQPTKQDLLILAPFVVMLQKKVIKRGA